MADDTPKSPEYEAAELRKLEAEARKAEIEAEKAAHELAMDRYYDERRKAEDANKDAADHRQGVYYFNTGVGGTSVKQCREYINERVRTHPGQPITIVLNSPGGSVFDGLDLGDAIAAASEAGCHITTIVAGMAASMAGVILQFGDHRVIGRNSWLHLHEVSAGAIGKASEIEDTADLMKRLTMQACDIYARRSTLSADDIYERLRRQEWWLSPTEALGLGFADEIR